MQCTWAFIISYPLTQRGLSDNWMPPNPQLYHDFSPDHTSWIIFGGIHPVGGIITPCADTDARGERVPYGAKFEAVLPGIGSLVASIMPCMLSIIDVRKAPMQAPSRCGDMRWGKPDTMLL